MNCRPRLETKSRLASTRHPSLLQNHFKLKGVMARVADLLCRLRFSIFQIKSWIDKAKHGSSIPQIKGVDAFYHQSVNFQGADRSTGGSPETESVFMSGCVQTPAWSEVLAAFLFGVFTPRQLHFSGAPSTLKFSIHQPIH